LAREWPFCARKHAGAPPRAAVPCAGMAAPAPPAGDAPAPAAPQAAASAAAHVLTAADVEGAPTLACPAPGCARAFKTLQTLNVHLRSHGRGVAAGLQLPAPPAARVGRFHCCADGCRFREGARTLGSLQAAVRHYRQVHAEKTLACDEPGCGAQFALACLLARHAKNAHGTTRCKCGVVFRSRTSLRSHAKQWRVNDPGTHGPADE
jgi:hypothetical protein